MKRSIGHLCHDEPREPTKVAKHGLNGNGDTVKQEDPLPYMLGPSIDQQQADEQMLQGAGVTLSSRTSGSQSSPGQLLRQSSNSMTQSQAFANSASSANSANSSQQCERKTQCFSALSLQSDTQSPQLQ